MPWAGLVAGVVAAAVVYLPQAAAYIALNGRLGPSRLVTRKMSWTSPHALPVLVSTEHGLFAWTPLALLALAGLVLLAAGRTRARAGDARRLGVIALLLVFLEVYVSGAVESWTVAGAFGQRRFVCLTALLALGLAALFNAIGSRAMRMAAAGLTVLCVWWNIGLMAQYRPSHHGPQRSHPVGERLADVRRPAPARAGNRVALPHRSRVLLRATASMSRAGVRRRQDHTA